MKKIRLKLLEFICCPDCHSELSLTEKITKKLIQEGHLYCNKCKDYYPIIDGIPILFKENFLTGSGIKESFEKSGTFWTDLNAKLYENFRAKLVARLIGGNIFTYDYVKDAIEPTANLLDIQKGDTILDIACGTGLLTRPLARRVGDSGNVVGLDISFDMLRYAKKYAERDGLYNIDLIKGNAEYLPYKNDYFNGVASSGIFPSDLNPSKTLDKMYRVLKKGGKLSLGAGVQCKYQGLKIRLVRKILDILTKIFNMRIKWIKQDELVRLVETAGFKNVQYLHLDGILCIVKGKK